MKNESILEKLIYFSHLSTLNHIRGHASYYDYAKCLIITSSLSYLYLSNSFIIEFLEVINCSSSKSEDEYVLPSVRVKLSRSYCSIYSLAGVFESSSLLLKNSVDKLSSEK